MKRLSRRDFFKATAALVAGAMIPPAALEATANRRDAFELNELMARPFRRAVDLTHVNTENFPTYFGTQNLEIETLNTPPRGTTLIVGGPKVTGATGGPSRLIALVNRGDDD